MPVTIDGTNGITTPTYGGTDTSEYIVPVTAFKNRIINGAMGIWQRGTSGFTTNLNYSTDRWFIVTSTSLSAVARSTDVPTGFQYSLSIAGTNNPGAYQRIESTNCTDLVGQSMTISFWAKQSSGAGTNSILLSVAAPNAADNYSAATQIGSIANFTGTSSWAQYTVTFTSLPSVVANGLQIAIISNVSGASTTLITGVQLEKGSTATSFDYRPYGTELALCQRYYYRIVSGYAGQIFGSSYNSTTSTALVTTPFPVTLRTNPTAIEQSGTAGDYRVNNLNTATTCTSVPAFNNATQYNAFTTFTTGATLTAGQASAGSCVNTNAYLGWNAEL